MACPGPLPGKSALHRRSQATFESDIYGRPSRGRPYRWLKPARSGATASRGHIRGKYRRTACEADRAQVGLRQGRALGSRARRSTLATERR
jgi:hypothetical protein